MPSGMSDGDGAAVRIDDVGVQAELADAGEALRCERFVEFDDVEVLDGEFRSPQGAMERRHRTHWVLKIVS